MNIQRFLFPVLGVALLLACQRDDEPINVTTPAVKTYPGVNEELWVYFQRFETEAAERGIDVNLVAARITGVIEELPEDRVLGQCNFNPNRPNQLLVDRAFWTNASDRFREFVVFHELGHCFLYRDHREDTLPTGACASLMRSGNGTCRDNYTAATRDFYLNELYDEAFFGDIFQ